MKRLKLLSGLLILLFSFYSCSNDENNSNNSKHGNLKPSSFFLTDQNEVESWLYFQYKGELLTKVIDGSGGITVYNYDGDRLISTTRSIDTEAITTNYIYENDKLIETRVENDGEIFKYYYNAEGQMNKMINIYGPNVIPYTFEYDSRGNVILSNINGSDVRFIYDDKNSPFKNVFPQLDPVFRYNWYEGRVNNIIGMQRRHPIDSTFSTGTRLEYIYNEYDFPIEYRIIQGVRILSTVKFTY